MFSVQHSKGLAKLLCGLVLIFFCKTGCVIEAAEPATAIDFNQQIRPILSENCYFCHGPDESHREADLRLDDREAAIEFLAIVPGKPDESSLLDRIASADPDEVMPPPRTKKHLSKTEIQLLKQWIEQGAEYQGHWSFSPVKPVAVPEAANKTWAKNPIDQFVLKRLEQKQLQPSVVANKQRLIRRVTFDITGLPPTLEEIDQYLADQSPDAYEKLVDRLLVSQRYGERMASEWLDVARYSDTYGYQVDRDRYVWPWRDWVIRAFNKNLTYDQFITQQLAGDLMPGATDEEILATTFNRLHPQKVEGGSTEEEFRIEYVADRTQTFGTAFLGMTLECCRCHSHKYDPIAHREYYQLSSFFDNIDESGLYSYFTPAIPTPTLILKSDQQKKQIADLENSIQQAEQQLQEIRKSNVGKTFDVPAEKEATGTEHPLIPGRVAHLDFEAEIKGGNQTVPGKVGNAVKLSGDDAVGLKVGNFKRHEPFTVSLWMNTPDVKERAVVFHRSRAWTDSGSRGYQLLIEDGKLSASLIHFWPGNAIRVKTVEQIPTSTWLHVAFVYDGSSRANGLSIFINGVAAKTEVVQDTLYKGLTGGGGDNITIGERFRDRGFTNGLVDEFDVFSRQLTPIEIEHLFDGVALKDFYEPVPDKPLTAEQSKRFFEVSLTLHDDEYKKKLAELQSLREQKNKIVESIPEIMVMKERATPLQTYLLTRGAYDARAEKVESLTPESLGPFPKGAPQNRLGLSQWLTDPQHPLTARVTVNRYWQMLFGQGLVRTPEDFGSQGSPPTHPELLDWLAHDFMTHNWDLKRLIKQIVTSATYRQSSAVTKSLLKQDPENLLLARFPSYRLPAEMIRDNAIATSGLLVNKIGGAPAKPYEVEVSFKPTTRSKGEGLYRRSVYTYWKRTGPAPVMMTLDASKRDVCRVKREKTSSPLQAFVLMNGPQFVEASRGLAQRLLQQHAEPNENLFHDLFRTMTSRKPTPQEIKILASLYESQLEQFKKDPQRAKQYLEVGDHKPDEKIDPATLAAVSVVANTLLNFDESVMKR